MPRRNPSPERSITTDPAIHEDILAATVREALQPRDGLAAVALWEKQHGRLTAKEMNEARRNVRAQLRTSRTVRRPA